MKEKEIREKFKRLLSSDYVEKGWTAQMDKILDTMVAHSIESTTNDDIKNIAMEVEKGYQIGGLSDGLYFDFARDVALALRAKELGEIRERMEELSGNLDYHMGVEDCLSLLDELIEKPQ